MNIGLEDTPRDKAQVWRGYACGYISALNLLGGVKADRDTRDAILDCVCDVLEHSAEWFVYAQMPEHAKRVEEWYGELVKRFGKGIAQPRVFTLRLGHSAPRPPN